MSCERYQELISSLLDGELSPAERGALSRHLSGCAECAALYEAFSGLSASLAEDLVEPPESLRENVMATLRREELLRRNCRRRTVTVAGMAACLALIVTLSLGALTSRAAMTRSAAAGTESAAEERGETLVLEEAESAASELRSAPAEGSAAGGAGAFAAPNAAPDRNAARAQTVSQADAEDELDFVTVDNGIMRLDLSDWLSRDALLAFLSGQPAETDAQTLTLLCRITVSDGGGVSTIWIYRTDRTLLYRVPGGGLYKAACNWASLLSFLSQGGSA